MIIGIDYVRTSNNFYLVVNYDNMSEVIHQNEISNEMYHFISEAKQYSYEDTVFYRMR